MYQVANVLLEYLDSKSLCILYDVCPDLRDNVLLQLEYMLGVIPISLLSVVQSGSTQVRDTTCCTITVDGIEKSILIAAKMTSSLLTYKINQEEKKVVLTHVKFDDVNCVIDLLNTLHKVIIEFVNGSFTIEKEMLNVHTSNLNLRGSRSIIAIPCNIVNKLEVDNIREITTFKDKFILI